MSEAIQRLPEILRLSDEAVHQAAADEIERVRTSRDELLEALQSTLRIVEALSYHTQLGRSQRERLDKAKALIGRVTSAANCVRKEREMESGS